MSLNFLSLEKEVFRGNILDIGLENNGIIYNVYKFYDEDIDVDYLEGVSNTEILKPNNYDTCIFFFSLNSMSTLKQKKKLFKEINDYLRNNAYIYIWDIDKKPLKTKTTNIRVVLPDKSIKDIKVNCKNPFTNNSKDKIIDMLQEFFDVLQIKHSNDIFSIICQKKGS